MASVFASARRFFDTLLHRIEKTPLFSFGIGLLLLVGLIALGNFLRTPKIVQENATKEPVLVEVYSFGEKPRIKAAATIEKASVISIYAQSPGIVSRVSVTEGNRVGRGQSIVGLATNYQGGNIQSLSREIAEKNALFTEETYGLQQDLIAKQRDLAEKGNTQATELRDITRKSLDDTRELIRLNEEIIGKLDASIRELQANNAGGVNDDAAILGAQQGKAAALSGLTSLRSTLRGLEYQSDESKIPAGLAVQGRDLTLKQLELQEKSLRLARDLSQLNVKIARVSESLMYPASPCAGTVERVYVKIGQTVTPGTLIATIRADGGETTAIATLPPELAAQVSRTEATSLIVNGKKISLLPRYVSKEATNGVLASVLYSLPAPVAASLTNGASVSLDIPLGTKTIVTDGLYVPIDALYQSTKASFVTIIDKQGEEQRAKTIEVTLGNISGSYVAVRSGLDPDDVVITTRTVQDGDRVRTE